MSGSPQQVVKLNLEIAKRVLLIFELKEKMDEIPHVFGGPFLDIRNLSVRVNEIKVATLPLILVFVASCLESYFKL